MNNVNAKYKRATDEEKEVTIMEKNIAHRVDLEDRIEVFSKSNCYITLKDHKDNFEVNTKCRLINTNKPQCPK